MTTVGTRLELRILGQVEVEIDGREVSLGGARQTALLVLLLLADGVAVSADRLAHELWAGSPPPGASKTLQVYVSRLRAVLGDGRVIRRGTGYCLDAATASVDATRFERLLGEGRARLANGDAAAAAGMLGEALALWRGPALAGLEHEDWARAAAARLEELRLQAVEDRVESELALGIDGRLVPELESLVSDHPLRERFRVQLMLALYRSGRQAEALAAFRAGRALLVDELGVEPGPELQDLHRRILDHDPALAPAGRVRRSRPSLRRPVAVAAAVVGIAAATTVVLSLARGGASGVRASAVVAVDNAGAVRHQASLTSPATDLAVGGDSIWALSGAAGTITKLSAVDGRAAATFAVGLRSVDVAFGAGRVWILASGASHPAAAAVVTELDPASLAPIATIPLPLPEGRAPVYFGHVPGAHLMTWSAGSLWVIDPGGTLDRIDVERRRIAVRVLGVAARAVAAAPGAVWVRVDQNGPATFVRVSARTDRPGVPLQTPAITLNAPTSFAFGRGALWVPDTYTGELYRILPGRLPTVRATSVGVGLTSVAYADGTVWAGDEIHDALTKVDASTGAVESVQPVPSPQAVAAVRAGAWVASGAAPATNLPPTNCGPVAFAGPGTPRFLIASDLALQGEASTVNLAMARAVRWELRRHGFRAGKYTVGLQSCDDSTPQAGSFDFARCMSNAQLYATTPRVLGIVGTYNSPCTGEELPLLDQAPGGAVPIVSPQNTFQVLTRKTAVSPPDTLRHFYPTGIRNFVRVTPIDTHEVAADALLMRQLGVRRVLVVADDQTGTSVIHTTDFTTSARRLHLALSVYTWHAEQTPAARVVAAVRRARADGVYVPALYAPRTAQLVRALVAAFGRDLPIVGTDFFDDIGGIWQTAGGPTGGRVYVSWFGVPNAQLPPAGRRFVRAFDPRTPSYGAAYAAEAADVLLGAIARSDGTRASVREQLFATDVRHGILGPIRFDHNGDLVSGPITILRLRRGPSPDGDPDLVNTVVDRVIVPPPSIVP